MVSIFIRTLIIYLLLSSTLKIMGKRQIGELDVNDLVSTLLISEIAAIPIDDPDLPLLNAVIPILFIVSLEIILSHAKTKSNRIKKCVEGQPSFIIYKGKLNQNALRENRISINEFLSEMRNQSIGSIEDVNYALIEQSGKLSFIKKENLKSMAHVLILDGEIIESELRAQSITTELLKSMLPQDAKQTEEIFLFTIDDNGHQYIITKEEK